MNEWAVVGVLATLVGLFFTVGKPIINLNSNITLLNASIKRNSDEIAEQKKELEKQRNHAHESHEKLWIKNGEQDEKIQDHETRISILEKSE